MISLSLFLNRRYKMSPKTDSPPPLSQVKKGCWHSFTHCLCGMWSTRETLPVNEDKEIVVRTTIR